MGQAACNSARRPTSKLGATRRNWTVRKYAMWARGEKLPSQQPSSLMGCPSGATFDSHVPAESQIHTPHIYAAQRA